MNLLIDSSVWVDFFRRSPSAVKKQAQVMITDPAAVVCQPILFELLRAVPRRDRPRVASLLATVPVLATPATLWTDAQKLGEICADAGFHPPAMDLVIAQVSLHHRAVLATSDAHFFQIAKVSPLNVAPLKPSLL